MSKRLFDTEFLKLGWSQSKFWLIYYLCYEYLMNIIGCHGNGLIIFCQDGFVMPPTSKKLEGHIASGAFVRPFVRPSVCSSVRPSVRPSVTPFDTLHNLNFLIWIPQKKSWHIFLFAAGLCQTPTRDFLKLDFRNKGLVAVNISNILNHKKVTSTIPAYFKNKSPPIISYSYSSPIAPKIFNSKKRAENITRSPLACSCKASEFCYNPASHIITVDLSIVRISKLRDSLLKGPKYRKPRYFTRKQNSKLILDSVEEYARRWAKKADVEVDTLSEWFKSVMSLVNRRVSVLSRTMFRRHESVCDDPVFCCWVSWNPWEVCRCSSQQSI